MIEKVLQNAHDGYMNFIYKEEPLKPPDRFFAGMLTAFNRANVEDYAYQLFSYVLKSNKDIAAGVECQVGGGWLYIESLWVAPRFQKRGWGTELLIKSEQNALEKGCHSAWLYTYSFQAPEFYKKYGYRIFGQLDDFFDNHRKYFLKKRIV